MAHRAVQLLDFPDEVLLIILRNLRCVEKLYSLEGINKRLDQMVVSKCNTSTINLATNFMDSNVYLTLDTILNRLCLHILPRIRHNVETFILEGVSMERVLVACEYPNLHNLNIIKFEADSAIRHLTDGSSVARLFKEQIKTLLLIPSCSNIESLMEVFTEACARIFALCKNLIRLDFNRYNDNDQARLSLCCLPTTTCFSSTLAILYAKVANFDDCLCLLDGRLARLTEFIVDIKRIDTSSLHIDNTKILTNLTLFSLSSSIFTNAYDVRILPLLRRMSYLKYLTLYFTAMCRSQFINGTHIDNEILSHMPQLNTFNFHIATITRTSDMEYQPSTDDIERTFVNWKQNKMKCYVDYFSNDIGKCNIYTIPYNFWYFGGVTHSFPGGIFKSVTKVELCDTRSFEHDFFKWITIAFPYLKRLVVVNPTPQKHKYSNDIINGQQMFPTISYPNLIYLGLIKGHIDYVDQFLRDERAFIPRFAQLRIKYEHLVTITNNFTSEATRTNCAQVRWLDVNQPIVYSENINRYFPLL